MLPGGLAFLASGVPIISWWRDAWIVQGWDVVYGVFRLVPPVNIHLAEQAGTSFEGCGKLSKKKF